MSKRTCAPGCTYDHHGFHVAACGEPPVSAGASPSGEKPEVCICAAIQFPDGKVVYGHRHDAALSYAGGMRLNPRDAVQGFVTTRHRFVRREEAARLQRAAGIPSADAERGMFPSVLFSEDLYRGAATLPADPLPASPGPAPKGCTEVAPGLYTADKSTSIFQPAGPAQPRAEKEPNRSGACPMCHGHGRIGGRGNPRTCVDCNGTGRRELAADPSSPRPAERREEPHESDWFRRAVSNAHQQVLAQALGVYLVMGYLPSARADMRDEILTVLRAQDRAAVRAFLEQRVQALEAEATALALKRTFALATVRAQHRDILDTLRVLKAELAALDRTIQGGLRAGEEEQG